MASAAPAAAAAAAAAEVASGPPVGKKRKRDSAAVDEMCEERSAALQQILLQWAETNPSNSTLITDQITRYRIKYQDHQLNRSDMSQWYVPIDGTPIYERAQEIGLALATPIEAIALSMNERGPHRGSGFMYAKVLLQAVLQNGGLRSGAGHTIYHMAAVSRHAQQEAGHNVNTYRRIHDTFIGAVLSELSSLPVAGEVLESCVDIDTMNRGVFTLLSTKLNAFGLRSYWTIKHARDMLVSVCRYQVRANDRVRPDGFWQVDHSVNSDANVLTFVLKTFPGLFESTRFGPARLHPFIALCGDWLLLRCMRENQLKIDWSWGSDADVARIPPGSTWMVNAVRAYFTRPDSPASDLPEQVIPLIPANLIDAPHPITGTGIIHDVMRLVVNNVHRHNYALRALCSVSVACDRPEGVDVWSDPSLRIPAIAAEWKEPVVDVHLEKIMRDALTAAQLKTGEFLIKASRAFCRMFGPQNTPFGSEGKPIPNAISWAVISYLAPNRDISEHAANCHDTMRTIASAVSVY